MKRRKQIAFGRFTGLMGIFVLQVINVFAQISEGGFPPGFQHAVTLRSSQAVEQIPVTFYVEDLKRVDEWQAAEGAPPAVATLIKVALNPQNSGRWSTLPGGEKIWQLHLQARGAIALMLYYSDFHIPEGGKLFLYNEEKTQLLGAYTHRTHPSGGRFATEFVAGDELTLEYVASPDDSDLRIEIEDVGYGYNHLSAGNGAVSLRANASCEVNVNCTEGDRWQSQKKGVCHMVQRIGSKGYLCSASLLNNTAQDLKPYILTAQHCAVDNDSREASEEDMKQWVFHFQYEMNGCGSGSGRAPSKTMSGCRKMAATQTNGESDGLLLLLNAGIPEEYDVYYNGWDRREKPALSGVGIHCPANDYMRISTYRDPAVSATFKTDNSFMGDVNAHWNVTFDETANGHGITEKGSSGSPLFNENQLVVGSLTGGSSTCYDPTGLNLYGKLSYHWDKYASSMDKYLDPAGSGAETLEGRYYGGQMPAPAGLQAVYESKAVWLDWEAPASGSPLKYRIYDNGTNAGETVELFHTETSPATGWHEYSVSAVYENGQESGFDRTSIPIPEYRAPVNVSAVPAISEKVAVLWEPPLYEQTVYWGSAHASTQIILDDTRRFYFGQLWEKEELQPFHRKTLAAIKYVPVRNNSYDIYIVQGNRTYRERIGSPLYGVTNTVPLSTPFVIDGSRPMIVSLYISRISNRPAEYPAMCDGGPAIQGKGNIYSYDAQNWNTLYDENDPDREFDLNFFVAAVITSAEGQLPAPAPDEPDTFSIRTSDTGASRRTAVSTFLQGDITLYSYPLTAFPEISGYNIYRNRMNIGTTSASGRRYVDQEPLFSARYQVSAQFGSDEGELSSLVNISTGNADMEENALAIYPTLFDDQVEVKGFDRVDRIEVYTTDGKCCLRVENPDRRIQTQSLPPGIYIFRIYPKDGTPPKTFRGIKKTSG
ncbi:MAG: T9SS type A sorting domain-containing protein [Tannerella sp.]|nr:T9SS type A sorting domain-containing protein [Tannerella sp.]